MKRTLLAVGFAVIMSMLLAPHGGKYGAVGFGPFLSSWCYGIGSAGIYYNEPSRVMIDMLILQTIFLAVLFAVCVNLRRPRANAEKKEKRERD
jgi:hypothetical protein